MTSETDIQIEVWMIEEVRYDKTYTVAALAEMLNCESTLAAVTEHLTDYNDNADEWLREDLAENFTAVNERDFGHAQKE